MRRLLIYHLPVLAYGAVILTVSSVPNLQTPEVRFLAFDKVAHFLEYALFAYLAFRSISNLFPTTSNQSTWNNRYLLITFLVLAGFAVLDEYLQSLTPGRHPDLLDYLFDVAGGTLVLTLLWLRRRRELRNAPEESDTAVQ